MSWRNLGVGLLVAGALSARAALTIDGAAIRGEGWKMDIYVNEASTNSTFTWNFASNNVPTSSNTVVLVVHTPGYDDSGNSNYVERTIYGTEALRMAYPYHTNNGIIIDGGKAIVGIAMSQYVTRFDTLVSFSVADNWYSNNVAKSGNWTPTNNSEAIFPSAIPGFTWHGWNRITNATFTASYPSVFRAFAFHQSAQNFRPVRSLTFIHRDESGHAITNRHLTMRIVNDVNDAMPFAEFVDYPDLSSFTALDRIRTDIVVEPWWGTNFTTLWDRWTQPTPLPASITNFYDPNNVYDRVAYVDDTGNNATAGVTNVMPGGELTGSYFSTIAAAMNALAASNNNRGLLNVALGRLFVREGVVNFPGGTISATTTPPAWTEISGYPGDVWTMTTSSGSGDNNRIKIKDCVVAGTSGTLFSSIEAVCFDNCTMTNASTGSIQTCPVVYVVRSKVPRWSQGFQSFGAQNTAFALVRGNNFDGMANAFLWFIAVGNYRGTNQAANSFNLVNDRSAWATPGPDFQIMYNNFWGGLNNNTQPGSIGGFQVVSNGWFVGNNVFEGTFSDSQSFVIHSSNFNSTNGNWVHNTLMSLRNQWFYNEIGTVGIHRDWCVGINSVFAKTGFHGHDAAGTQNANRTNNWNILWGVGSSGNFYLQTVGVGSDGGDPEFKGMITYRPFGTDTTTPAFPQFQRPKDFVNGSTNGNGFYDPKNVLSPIITFIPSTLLREVLPYDLRQRPRHYSENFAGAENRSRVTLAGSGSTILVPLGSTILSTNR